MADSGMVAVRDALGKILEQNTSTCCARAWRWCCAR